MNTYDGASMSIPQNRFRESALLRDQPSTMYEPAPLEAFTRLPSYTWLIVGVTCVGAFIGQLDASIVQLALPHHDSHQGRRTP